MRIIHRISIASTPQIHDELVDLRIDVPDDGIVTFEVSESDENWTGLEQWAKNRRAVDIVTTNFTKDEIASAAWLELVSDWFHGYPEPRSNDFGYLSTTYESTARCSACGVGSRQVAPFRMKAEPKWGRKSILQLYWVYDEFFVTPDAWSRAFKPSGIESLPVLNSKGTAELATVVQLKIEAETGINVDRLPHSKCDVCGVIKYSPVARGAFPALIAPPQAPIAKTKEYFGSGASASKRVVVSQDLARVLTQELIRGVSFRPVEGSFRPAGE